MTAPPLTPGDDARDGAPTGPPFDVVAFSKEAFIATLAGHRHVTVEQLADHRQAQYLARYLEKIHVATMVVERDYTDPHFLDDVATYYVRSHEDYPRRCVRLHFFTDPFDASRFRDELLDATLVETEGGGRVSYLQAHYRGFLVVRPLPVAVIGRTVLATYPPIPGKRYYPGVRPYTAHLFGTELVVESLAYQQQDTVLAACATVALWSSFQKASDLFGTISPTPAEITRAANSAVFATRSLPSRGLTLQQMTRAIAEIGLEPEVIPCTPDVPVVSAICAYLDLGLPVVLNVAIESYEPHAITVVGYSLAKQRRAEPEYEAHGPVFIPQLGGRVDQLYVHDDNSGPFMKLLVKTRPSRGSAAFPTDGRSAEGAGVGAREPDGGNAADDARPTLAGVAHAGGRVDALGAEGASAEGASADAAGADAYTLEEPLPTLPPVTPNTSDRDVSARSPESPSAGDTPALGPAPESLQRMIETMVRQAVSAELERVVPPKPLVYFEAPNEWRHRADPSRPARIEPKQIVVPVYHKVRLAFMDLQTWLVQMTTVVPLAIEDYDERAEWRTQLTTLIAFKAEVRDGPLPAAERERLLLERMPRFLWRSVLYEEGERRMELVFDATGMQRSFPLLTALYYDDTFRDQMRDWLNDPEVAPLLSTELRTFLQRAT